jgi:UDP-glucuronate 4-epimerase
MTTLVTGGAGFVGSRLALALHQAGETVVVVDNFNDYYDPALKRANVAAFPAAIQMIEADIRDAPQMEHIVATHGVRRIAHMAAMAGVRYSIERAPLYYEVNVQGTINLMEAARKHNVRHFIMASTGSVYGQTQRLPFNEEDPADKPLASYPASKRAAELFAHSYHHLFGLDITCLRLFNVYGPGGRPDMMPMRVMQALCNGEPITIFGDGTLSRDWTYIDDTVTGLMTALEKPLGYEAINLGVGAPISINTFVDILEELSGREANRVYVPTPPSEPPITFCDNSKAKRLLGFAPSTPIHEGLARTWAWFSQTVLQD